MKLTTEIAAKRAERPDHQLGHVEPGDILHHHAAGLHELAFEGDELHADDEIARRAVEPAPRAAGIGGDDTAHGGVVGKRGIERDHLPVLGQQTSEFAPGEPGGDADREIARFVLRSRRAGRGC